MKVDPDTKTQHGADPFVEAVKELIERKQPYFLGKPVEGAYVILTVRDGNRLRAAIATVNADQLDLMTASLALSEMMETELLQLGVPDGEVTTAH